MLQDIRFSKVGARWFQVAGCAQGPGGRPSCLIVSARWQQVVSPRLPAGTWNSKSLDASRPERGARQIWGSYHLVAGGSKSWHPGGARWRLPEPLASSAVHHCPDACLLGEKRN